MFLHSILIIAFTITTPTSAFIQLESVLRKGMFLGAKELPQLSSYAVILTKLEDRSSVWNQQVDIWFNTYFVQPSPTCLFALEGPSPVKLANGTFCTNPNPTRAVSFNVMETTVSEAVAGLSGIRTGSMLRHTTLESCVCAQPTGVDVTLMKCPLGPVVPQCAWKQTS
jgi:hypothetical protein